MIPTLDRFQPSSCPSFCLSVWCTKVEHRARLESSRKWYFEVRIPYLILGLDVHIDKGILKHYPDLEIGHLFMWTHISHFKSCYFSRLTFGIARKRSRVTYLCCSNSPEKTSENCLHCLVIWSYNLCPVILRDMNLLNLVLVQSELPTFFRKMCPIVKNETLFSLPPHT